MKHIYLFKKELSAKFFFSHGIFTYTKLFFIYFFDKSETFCVSAVYTLEFTRLKSKGVFFFISNFSVSFSKFHFESQFILNCVFYGQSDFLA